MRITRRIQQAIIDGEVTLVFHRAKRQTLYPGLQYSTDLALLVIDRVEAVDEDDVTESDARRAGFDSRDALLKSVSKREGQLYRITVRDDGTPEHLLLQQKGKMTEQEVLVITGVLKKLDRLAVGRPWAETLMNLISEHPEATPAQLAKHCDFDKNEIKDLARHLEYLELVKRDRVRYRLTPRGRAIRRIYIRR